MQSRKSVAAGELVYGRDGVQAGTECSRLHTRSVVWQEGYALVSGAWLCVTDCTGVGKSSFLALLGGQSSVPCARTVSANLVVTRHPSAGSGKCEEVLWWERCVWGGNDVLQGSQRRAL